MGARGPLPQPYARRRNPRPERGVVTTGRPVMPRDLAPKAKEECKRVVDLLEEIGSLHATDQSLLVRYCSALAEWCEIDEQLARTGRLVRRQKGNPVRNPLWLLRRDAGQALNELGAQMGLSPGARLRNGVRHVAPPDPKEDEDQRTRMRELRARLGVMS